MGDAGIHFSCVSQSLCECSKSVKYQTKSLLVLHHLFYPLRWESHSTVAGFFFSFVATWMKAVPCHRKESNQIPSHPSTSPDISLHPSLYLHFFTHSSSIFQNLLCSLLPFLLWVTPILLTLSSPLSASIFHCSSLPLPLPISLSPPAPLSLTFYALYALSLRLFFHSLFLSPRCAQTSSPRLAVCLASPLQRFASFPLSPLRRQHPTPHLLPPSLPFLFSLYSAFFFPLSSAHICSSNTNPLPFQHAALTPITLHYWVCSFLSLPPPSHFRDDAWLHISVSFKQPHARTTHTHTFSLLIYSACVMSPSRLTAEVLMLRASGGYR